MTVFYCFIYPMNVTCFMKIIVFIYISSNVLVNQQIPPFVFFADYNADIQSESVSGSELKSFCDINSLCFIDISLLLPDSFTGVSQTHDTIFWLDHCVSTTSG